VHGAPATLYTHGLVAPVHHGSSFVRAWWSAGARWRQTSRGRTPAGQVAGSGQPTLGEQPVASQNRGWTRRLVAVKRHAPGCR